MKRSADRGFLLFGAEQGDVTTSELIPPTAGEEETPDAGEEQSGTRERFRELIEGEYKEAFTEYFNEIFAKRFKQQKGEKEELSLLRAVAEAARARYGVEELAALPSAIRADTEEHAPTEQTAEKNRTSVQEGSEPLDVLIRREVEQAIAQTKAQTERAVLAGIGACGLRPTENALSIYAFTPKGERIHLTRAERAAVAARAAKGEKITF